MMGHCTHAGVVTDVDEEELQVKCMHRIGPNRFYWPALREDICWYSKDDLICEIPQPEKVTDKHFQVKPVIWKDILEKF